MSTRGLYGIRLNGVDKCTYNHSDSYPSWLGREIIEFCKRNSLEKLHEFYNSIKLVSEKSIPTVDEIVECLKSGYYRENVSTKSVEDWYCLLRDLQGNFAAYEECIKERRKILMTDGIDFIKSSLFCEYAYIINLDDETLEFYKGYQKKPQDDNRYGTTPDEDGYYPCRLQLVFSLDELMDNTTDFIVEVMECGSYEIAETMELYSEYDLTAEEAKEIGDKKVIALWESVENAAREEAISSGLLNDSNERYFDLSLYGRDLLQSDGYMELESGRIIYYEY